MRFFSRRRAARESVLLVDIGSGSVGAAYLSYGSKGKPALHHAVRIPSSDGEDATAAVSEAIKRVVTEGAPLLRDATGSGYASRAVVSVASPWQEMKVVMARRESETPFSFTRSTLTELTNAEDKTPMGFTRLNASVIATLLNGYQVTDPIGKKAKRAEAVVVTTSIETRLKDHTTEALRTTAHIRSVSFVSFPWLSYAALHDLYPHERDYLILDAAGHATDITVVSRGLLADTSTAPKGVRVLQKRGAHPASGRESMESGVHIVRDLADTSAFDSGKKEWLESIVSALSALSHTQALPRTVFLLSDPDTLNYVKTLMDNEQVRSLWLTSEALSVIPVLPAQLSAYVVADSHDATDVFLLLIAYHAMRASVR